MIEPQRPFSPPTPLTGSSPVTEAPTQLWLPPVSDDPPPKRPLFRWLMWLLLALIVGTAVLGTGATATLFYYSEMLLPGSSVSLINVPLGGLTQTEAIARLESAWTQQAITLTMDGTPAHIATPEQLGVLLDAEATVAQAHRQSRSVAAVWQAILFGEGVQAAPVLAFDPAQAEQYLQEIAPAVAVSPVEPTVAVQNGQLVTTPATAGQSLDVSASRLLLQSQGGLLLETRTASLQLTAVLPTITDVSAAIVEIEQLLNQSLTVQGFDPIRNETVTWELTRETWGNWLTIALAENGQATWSLDEGAAADYLSEQASLLGDARFVETAVVAQSLTEALATRQDVVSTRIHHATQEHVVQSGETLASIGFDYGIPYPWIQQANPTVGDTLFVGQSIRIPSPDELLPLPVVANKRIVVSMSEQRVRVFENNALKWDWLASTGIASSPTAPGVFQIQNHVDNAYAANWDLHMPNFMGIYRPVPTSDFMNGFHGFPTRDGSNLLWTSSLGTQVTYGCVLLSNENVTQLYEWAEEGVVVEIVP